MAAAPTLPPPTGMLLRATATSPFGRKVMIALMRLGLHDAFQMVDAAPLDENDSIRRDNPLGKMPCLVLANGEALFDSPVIVEYLNASAGGGLIPAVPWERLAALREQALADGILDAAVLMGSERMFHPADHVSARWLDHQRGKVQRGLAAFDRAPPSLDPPMLGAISLACALGYLDWRKPVDWRADHPPLAAWLDAFRAAVPEFDATAAG